MVMLIKIRLTNSKEYKMRFLQMLMLCSLFLFGACAHKHGGDCKDGACSKEKSCCSSEKKCEGDQCQVKEGSKCCDSSKCSGKCEGKEGDCQKCKEGKCDGQSCEVKKADQAAPAQAAEAPAPKAKKSKKK